MTIRIRESQVTAVLIDEWYKVQLGTFQIDHLELRHELSEWGFLFTMADHDNAMVTGPLDSIRGYRMVKE